MLADLREKAAGQGLTLIDNDGLGNCMFSALCHQLKIKKRLKQYLEMELRTELAQYLEDHPIPIKHALKYTGVLICNL